MKDRSALDAAKSALESYLRHLGINPQKNFNCLFHDDKNPSMHMMSSGDRVYCFSCHTSADIVDVIAKVENVDMATAIARAQEFAGTAPPPKEPSKPRAKVDLGTIHRHIAWAIQAAGDPRVTEFLQSRGFSPEDIARIVPEFNIGYDSIHKTLVIPHGTDYYTARRIDECAKAERFRFNAAAPVQLFNSEAIGAEVFAVTEGALDALSLIVCGMPAVALGGAGTHGKLLTAVTRLKAPARILLALDNDESGRRAADKLAEKLKPKAIALPMFPTEYLDFNEFLQGDRAGLQSFLGEQRQTILSMEKPPEPEPAPPSKVKRQAKPQAGTDAPPLPVLHMPDGKPCDFVIQYPFCLSSDGLFALSEKKHHTLSWLQISHTAIVIDTIIENVDDGTLKARLGFYEPHRGWCKTPALDLAVLKSAIRLSDVGRYGVDIRSTKARYIVDYLAHFEARNAEKIKRILTVNRPGWQADGSFVYPNSAGAKYQLDDNVSAFVSRLFGQKGDCAAVIAKIKELTRATPIAWVLIGAVLAAPLVHLLARQNLAIHIYGNTGCGKSSLTKFAVSLLINPNTEGALPTANATKVGLELLFASMFDFAVVVEDIDSISDEATRHVISELPYQFVNKTGRLRGRKDGGLQKLNEFRGTLLTNGERPITDDASKGGGKRRVIELKVADNMLSKKDARRLHQFLHGNYGLLGRSWIELITDYTTRGDRQLELLFNEFDSILLAKYESKVPLHIDGIALIATANFLLSKALRGEEPSTDLTDDTSFAQSLRLACTILDGLPDESEIADWQRAAKYVRDWIAVHKKYFHSSGEAASVPFEARKPFEEYGVMKLKAGSKDENASGYVGIVPAKLKAVLRQGGYAAESVIRQFVEHGFIQRHNEKRIKWAERDPITGLWLNLYRIPREQIDEAETAAKPAPADDSAHGDA